MYSFSAAGSCDWLALSLCFGSYSDVGSGSCKSAAQVVLLCFQSKLEIREPSSSGELCMLRFMLQFNSLCVRGCHVFIFLLSPPRGMPGTKRKHKRNKNCYVGYLALAAQ